MLFRAARQLKLKVLVSTTTHLACDETRLADRHFIASKMGDLHLIESQLVGGVNLITGPQVSENRMGGLNESLIAGVRAIADQQHIPLLIEADGSRQRPIKAPATHEPPIPSWVNTVAVVAGMSAVGQPLDENTVFRSEVFAKLCGKQPGELIWLEDIFKMILHSHGGLKNIPEKAEKIVILNQLDRSRINMEDIEGCRQQLLADYHSILVTSMEDEADEVKCRLENVAGIILAAGESTRFGKPKQLLTWKGKSFIRHVVEAAMQAVLQPVVMVLGAEADKVKNELDGYPINIIINQEWNSGQASSIVTGISSVMGQCGAALFLLSDMPQISADIINRCLKFQKYYDFTILAPRIHGQPGNPAMFDKRCFNDLQNLHGDAGGRQLFNRYPVTWLDFEDSMLTFDVDSPEDYQRLLELDDAKKME